jgi:hypothetical protein
LSQRNIDNAIRIISKNVISLSKDKYFPIQQALPTAKAKKTHQLNKVTKEMYEDLLMLKYFV